ncbi:NADH-quinone oxidoreductase subunit NuoK [Candidatus Poribacteria bacterium]|nr:NADH-quinone oxidoreductase subunit NuoK [Candidatus Poribacteria bacterium]
MTLSALLVIGLLLFTIGAITVLSRRNLIIVLIGIELMMTSAALNFMAFNRFIPGDGVIGQVAALVVLGLSAGEVAIFLSIILVLYRKRNDIDIEELTDLKG